MKGRIVPKADFRINKGKMGYGDFVSRALSFSFSGKGKSHLPRKDVAKQAVPSAAFTWRPLSFHEVARLVEADLGRRKRDRSRSRIGVVPLLLTMKGISVVSRWRS